MIEAIFFEENVSYNFISIWQRVADFVIQKIRIPGTGLLDPEWQIQIHF